MIQFYNVTKIYPNGTVALSNFNLKINRGEFVFLVGPSGAGKSTVIKLIFRERIPTGGQIFIDGKNTARLKHQQLPNLRRSIGVVFQDFKLLPNKTVFENVAFALEVVEKSKSEIEKRVPAVLKLVGLSHKMNVRPSELSGGEQQRVSIARAIVNNPMMVVADEPTGNLDPETSWGIMEVLNEINKRGTTVIMATHDKSIVDRSKKRVVVIENGKVSRDQQRSVYDGEN